MAASGVRSSWLASETNRFIFSVVVCCWRKLRSICASIVLSDFASVPTSVPSGASGTRCDRSPAAIFAAVFSMRLSGLNVRCTVIALSTPPSSTTAAPTMTQNRVRLSIMSIWLPSDRPM